MLIEEEEPKSSDINPDALEAVFDEEVLILEEETIYDGEDEEDEDGVDFAFNPNDEDYW